MSTAIYGFIALRALYSVRYCHRLPMEVPQARLPLVSIIFAARDEEHRIEQTLRHLLAQQHLDFEIIPVDDRSRDRTSQILKKISAADPRVKPKRIDALPEGWLGKCHACHVGAHSAQGEWLLFTDADCWLKPHVIASAICVADREDVEHITLTPGVAHESTAAEAWHLTFLVTIADWIERVNRDRPNAHLGVGAFNLVRAKTYRAFGGHEPLRLTVLDDVKFGRMVRRANGRTRAFIGGDDVECHWGATLRDKIKLMEKNYFATINYHTVLGLLLGTIPPILWLAALIGPFTGSLPGIAAGTALLLTIVPASIFARRLGWSIGSAFVTPFIYPTLFYAILNSTVVTVRQGGIRWRDTFYPLDLLRKHTVR